MKKKFYSLVLLLGLPLMVCAQEKIGNLWYSASETGVKVIQSQDDTEYAGDIIIPAMVTYSGEESLVTSIDKEAFTGCSKQIFNRILCSTHNRISICTFDIQSLCA